MITRTQRKLDEARFFLACLESHWRHVPHVDYFLSAFVSAARSVTWIMRAEYSSVPGWEQWYDQQKPNSRIRELLKRMNEVRVRSTKTTPLQTKAKTSVKVRHEDGTPEYREFLEGGAKGFVHLEPLDRTNTVFNLIHDGKILARAHLEKAEHLLPEFEGRDSKDVCREYLNILEVLVKDCEVKFRPNQAL